MSDIEFENEEISINESGSDAKTAGEMKPDDEGGGNEENPPAPSGGDDGDGNPPKDEPQSEDDAPKDPQDDQPKELAIDLTVHAPFVVEIIEKRDDGRIVYRLNEKDTIILERSQYAIIGDAVLYKIDDKKGRAVAVIEELSLKLNEAVVNCKVRGRSIVLGKNFLSVLEDYKFALIFKSDKEYSGHGVPVYRIFEDGELRFPRWSDGEMIYVTKDKYALIGDVVEHNNVDEFGNAVIEHGVLENIFPADNIPAWVEIRNAVNKKVGISGVWVIKRYDPFEQDAPPEEEIKDYILLKSLSLAYDNGFGVEFVPNVLAEIAKPLTELKLQCEKGDDGWQYPMGGMNEKEMNAVKELDKSLVKFIILRMKNKPNYFTPAFITHIWYDKLVDIITPAEGMITTISSKYGVYTCTWLSENTLLFILEMSDFQSKTYVQYLIINHEEKSIVLKNNANDFPIFRLLRMVKEGGLDIEQEQVVGSEYILNLMKGFMNVFVSA